MTLSNAPTHEWSHRYTGLLADVIAGRAAPEVSLALRAAAPPDGRVAVAALPSFVAVSPAIDLGRKARTAGRATLFPARVVWDGGPVHAVPAGGRAVVDWELAGLGVELTGSTVIDASGAVVAPSPEPASPVVTHVVATPVSLPTALAELAGIAERGEAALWDARLLLERSAAWHLRRTHVAVANEVSDGEVSSLLDEPTIDGLVDELLLGDASRGVSPAIDRLIERTLAPRAFARVDPQRLVTVALRSAAETAIRRRIGDPHIGRKVRALARASDVSDPREVLRRYRELWPGDGVGAERVEAALQATSTRPVVLLGSASFSAHELKERRR